MSALAGLVAFGRPTLRRETKEMSATLNNRSVFVPPRIHEHGISADNVQARIATLDQNDCHFEIHGQIQKGKTIWVNWDEDGPGDDTNSGLSPEVPMFTTRAALGKLQSVEGDAIIRMGYCK